ncbi:hypothetical protein SLE2022_127640 [Rubroshorea leprosula]
MLTNAVSSKNTVLSNDVVALESDAKRSIEGPVLEFGYEKFGSQSSIDSCSSGKEPKDQNTLKDLTTVHTSPIQNTPPKTLAHDQPKTYHSQDSNDLQNVADLCNTESLNVSQDCIVE